MALPTFVVPRGGFAIIETVNPARGTATLTHDPHGGLPDSFQRKLRKIQLDAPPWNHTGRQPYAWDYTPAESRQGFPVLTLVLDRNVRMLWSKADWSGTFGPDNPCLVLVRAQDSDLVPSRRSPVRAHQLVHAAYPWDAARDDTVAWWVRRFRDTQSPPHSATVIPFENGVTVKHDGGDFEFSVIAPLAERAAFAYEIIFPQEIGYWFRCVHTSNVEISGWQTRDFDAGIPLIFLQHAVVHRIDQVPAQGAVLSPDRFAFEYFTDFKIRLSSSARRVVLVLESVIGLIPIVGALYDAAQLVYTVANGRTFWGEAVVLSDDEICLQGLCAILNVAVSAAEVTSALGRVIKARPRFAPALDKGVADSLRRNLDSRFFDAFGNLSSDEQKKLVDALNAYAAGRLESRGVLSVANEGVAGKLKTLSDEQRALDNVFSENLASFRSADLAEGYERYLAKGRGRPRRGPIEWALKQTTGRYVELLRRELGDGFRSVLQSLVDANVVKTVSPEALALIDRYGAAVSHYRDLRGVAAGYGDFFEVDHLFEKRFWKSPRLNDIIDQSDFMAMIVARDPQIAQQIPRYRGYVHSQKTDFLRYLIPNGQEDLFTVQQWWDAHVYVGRQVGIPEDVLRGEFRDEFEFLVKNSEHPEHVDFRFDQADADFKPPKWRL